MKCLLATAAVMVLLSSSVCLTSAAQLSGVQELLDPRHALKKLGTKPDVAAKAGGPTPELVLGHSAVSAAAGSGGTIEVRVKVQYPASNLPQGGTLGIRGSNPLSWTETIPLTSSGTDEWTTSFAVTGVNSTYPTWAVDTKVVVETGGSVTAATTKNVVREVPTTKPLPVSRKDGKSVFGTRQNVKDMIFSNSDGDHHSSPAAAAGAGAGGTAVWMLGCNHRFVLKAAESTTNVTMWPWFTQSEGVEVTLTNVHSPQLNNNRSVWLYIPPGSVENQYRYETNVNVFQDGQNLAPLWHAPDHLNKHIMGETMESLFVIGPHNMDANRTYEYTYVRDPNFACPGSICGGGGDIYLDFVEQTLVPLVASKYNIKIEQENLGILGSSLGGLIACYAGITRPHIYGKVGCMSSSFWWDYDNFRKTIIPQLSAVNAKTQVYYIDSGDSGATDDGREETSLVTSMFTRMGDYGPESSSASTANGNPINLDENFVLGTNLFYYLQRGGHHNEYFWSKRLHHPLQWLYFRDAIWNTPTPG